MIWTVQIYGEHGSAYFRTTEEALRHFARLIGLLFPEPKETTIVRVELHQVEQGRRRRRKRVEALPAAAGDVDPEKEAIKQRMLAGR